MRRNLRVFIVAISVFLLLLGNPCSTPATEFAAAKSYRVGTSPGAVVIADFNGDGKTDIAVANTGSNNVSILLGNGDGTFQPPVNFAAGNSPSVIAVGDFNGDGKLDLAVFQPANSQNSVAGSVSILLGNGDGTFQAPKTTPFAGFAAAMAVADFNLDKKSDLAVTIQNFTSGLVEVEIFLSKGDGTFQSAGQTRTPNADVPVTLAAADFNGDSKPDLAVTTSNVGIQILLGKGDGTFLQGATVAPALPARSVLTADLNHDGKTDLVVASSRTSCGRRGCGASFNLSVFLGNGDGTFQGEQIDVSGAANPFVGDFNGDGKLDVAFQKNGSLEIQLEPVAKLDTRR